jgi:hypothetical protein
MTRAGASVAPSRQALGSLPAADPKARKRAQRAASRAVDRRTGIGDEGLALWRGEQYAAWRGALDAMDQAVAAERPLPAQSESALGQIAALLTDTVGRDAVVASICAPESDVPNRLIARPDAPSVHEALAELIDPTHGRAVGHDRGTAAEALLALVAAHASAGRRGNALAVMAWAAWYRGDGARAQVYLDLAEECSDPPALTGLVRCLVDHCLSPRAVRRE